MANINSIITYNANLSPAQAQIKALTGQIAGLTAAFNTLDKSALSAQRSLSGAFSANVGQIGGFTAQTIQAHNAVENFGKQLAANRLTMRQYFREAFAGYTKQNSLMKQLAAQQVRYQQSVAVPMGGGQMMMLTPTSLASTGTSAAMAAQKFAVFNKLIDAGATSMLNWGKNTQWAGRQLMVGFTVPLAMFTAVASKQFRDLDKELTRFQKVYGSDLGGSMSKATEQMRKQVQALAYDISRTYGIAAKDTAALAADIAATGAEGEKLISSVQQTTRLAVLGEVDRQEAMKATLALQSAFKMNTNELADSINFLNAVENQTSTTLEDLAGAIPRVGPVIRSLGGDVEDLATLLVAMREGGVPAAEAANALKSGLASLINPTKQASEVAKSFGVNLVGIVEANRGQLMPTIYAVQDALSGLDSFSKSKVIEQIFGKYQFARMTALFDNLGKAGSQTQSVLELASKNSSDLAAIANQEIRTLTESTSVRFMRAVEELKNTIIPLGEVLTQTFIPIFETIGKGMKIFTTFFQSLPEPIKNFTKYSVAIAALAGPIIMLVGLFGNLIANGIKFGMMMVRVGARISGLKVEKFELLNTEVMAAKFGVDNLTASFETQEVAMRRLIGVLSTYQTSLRELTTTNPALFIPGAVPPPGGRMPIRRQTGSSRPEIVPGSGRGDHIPALLEPGEFIVNRSATQKYAPVLAAMNRGTLQGFENGGGTDTRHRQRALKSDVFVLRGLGANISSPGGLAGIMSISAKNIADVTSLYVKEIASAAGTSVAAINKEVSAWKTSNAPLLKKFNQDLAKAIQTGNLPEQQRLIKEINDKFIKDMRAAGGPVSQFAAKAKIMFPELAADLIQTQAIIEKTKLDLNNAEDAAEFYAKNMEKTALLSRMGQPGRYQRPAAAAAGVLPMLPGVTPAQYLRTYGIPAQFMDPGVRRTGGDISSYGIRSEAGRLALLRAGTSAEHVSKTVVQIETYSEKLLEEGAKASVRGARKAVRPGSPSRTTIEQFDPLGVSLGQGAIVGLTRGYKSAVAGKQIIAGPVGGTGIESISNAQKIVQADQSILKLKDMQLKHTADRVRAEVELLALQKAYARGEINIVQFKEQERKLVSDQKLAAEKELRIQNIINEKKQRIAEADTAQLRAEQEEAKNAARRATASMVAPGGLYGPGGYNVFGNVGRTSTGTAPGPKVPSPGVITGPAKTLRDSQPGMRGQGLTNAAFALSMAVSSISMMGGASADAASKLGLFTTALMTATMLMNTGLGKSSFTNFLGMRSLGGKLGGTSAARLAANPALAQRAASIASAGGLAGGRMAGQTAATAAATGGGRLGATLLGASRVLGVAGGPIGIGVGLAVTAAVTGFMMYKKAADEARERAIAAFNDPVKSAEYFGETIMNVTDILEKNKLSNLSEELANVDQNLRNVVKEDYGPLIEQIKYLGEGAGAQQLSVAYSNMILSGMSADNAKAAVEAIAAEAGVRGGEAFNEAVAQGMFKKVDTEKAIQNIVGQFTPASTEFGKSGMTIQQKLLDDIAKTEQRIKEIQSTPVPAGTGKGAVGVGLQLYGEELAALNNQLDALKDRLQDLQTINPDLVSGVMDSIVMAYQTDPTSAINGLKDFVNTIQSLPDEGDRLASMQKLTEYLKTGYGDEWNVVGASIDSSNEKLLAAQMLVQGISLSAATDSTYQFNEALAQTLVTAKLLADETAKARVDAEEKYFGRISRFAEKKRQIVSTEIRDLENARDAQIKIYEERKTSEQEAFDASQKNSQDTIDSLQKEMDTRREAFDDRMKKLEDEKTAIQDSSDIYIKSLQKRKTADTFYAQQRKSSMSALQKLASGDVFGFIQERQGMSQDAQKYSYDQQIKQIEDRRDLEVDAIDKTMKKQQEKQDQYEKNMQDKIDSEQELMDLESEAHDNRMKHLDDQIAKVKRIKEQQLSEKRTELKNLDTMEQDYRDNSVAAEEKWSKEYTKLKTDPYVKAREELQILKVKEIWYRGGITLEDAAAKAGIGVPRTWLMGKGEIFGGGMGGRGPDAFYNSVYQGITDALPQSDTSTVSQQVNQMDVTAQNVTINGGGTSGPPAGWRGKGWNYDGTPDPDGDPTTGGGMATGGYISGPGGPKSDVIPALLSNGEYVVQASSVGKYGKSMMDAINAGKYATGGYISADRAETAAQGNVYGGKPKPQYSGGTPTYSGRYTNAGKQEYSNYKNKNKEKVSSFNNYFGSNLQGFIPPTMRGKEQKEILAPIKNWMKDIRVGLATSFDVLATGFTPPWLRAKNNIETSIGKNIGGKDYVEANAFEKLMSFLNMIPIGSLIPKGFMTFANGGIIGYKDGTNNPTWYSADRAEQAATGTRGSPKPQYSGGTPTYSGGYTSTNKQAHSKYKKPQIGGGNFGRPGIDYPSFNAPSFKQEVGSLWDSLRVGLATVADSFAAPFLHPFGIRGSSDQTTALGRFIGGNSYGNASIIDKLSAAMSIIPIGGVGKSSAFDANAAAAKYFPNTVGKKPTVEGLYNPTVNDSLILKEDPFSLLHPTKARDTYLDEIFSQIKGGQGGVSPGGFVIGRDGIERYIKSPASDIPQAAYAEVFTTKLYDALGFKVPETSLLRLGAESRAYKIPTPIRYRSDPFAEDVSTFKPGSLVVSSKKLQYDTSGGSYGPEILARELGFGTAMDQWMHFTDMHPGNYLPAHGTAYRMDFGSNPFYNASGEPISPAIYTNQSWLPLRKEPQGYPSISPAEISDQWRVLSNAVENRGGLKKLIQLVSDDILGTTGIELGNKSSVISFLENRLREGLKLTENPDNMHISTLPRKSFSHLANGGMVGKFAEGGEVFAPQKGLSGILSLLQKKEKKPKPTDNLSSNLPDTSLTGSPNSVPKTTTILGGISGPNGWPYSTAGGGRGFPMATGTIPGTSVSITMNKDVLPLFLAFASDYNKMIKPIKSSMTGGYDVRGAPEETFSNHPSGTALDINWNEEGSHYSYMLGSDPIKTKANFNWWKGTKSTYAPWKSISPIPYKTMNSLIAKYKVLQWFGPTGLSNTQSYLDWNSSDPMHVQINQDTDPSPEQVASVIASLGINPNGTFNRPSGLKNGGFIKKLATGGYISGPGGPLSDMIPAMLSNGEYVVKAGAVNKYGKGFMDQLNAGNIDFNNAKQFANGGMIGATPTFGMPEMASISPSNISANVSNNYAGSTNTSSNSSSKVNIVINGANNNANAIANKVISIINEANGRRNHSRSV